MKQDNLTVLSLFGGMECGRITLERMGITPKKYYSSEIDKFARNEVAANYPCVIQLGDVTKWREWDIDWSSVDLLIGGSPCQGFSFAGKQLAFDDPRSALFFVYVDILNHVKSVNPDVKFMLENVKMKKEHLNVITEYLGVEPVFINSALLSAQNRQRYYWANWEITQPEDHGILLSDIIEKEPTSPVYMTDKFVNRQKGRKCLVDDFERKGSSLSSMEYVKNGRQGNYINQESFEEWYSKTKDWGGTREEWEALQIQVNSAAIVGRKINPETGKREDYNKDLPTVQTLEVQSRGKARCLSAVSKDCLVSHLPPGRYTVNDNSRVKGITENDQGYRPHRGDDRKTGISELGRIYKTGAKVHTLTTSHQPKLALNDDIKDLHYRKLTVVECCRLQGVPDNYFKVSSNTQAYKMLGNGWQCDTIEHIFNCLFGEL